MCRENNRVGTFVVDHFGGLLTCGFRPRHAASRVLVVEYKGEHLFAEAEEKRAVGAVWKGRSDGRCLFVIPEGKDLEAIRRKISRKKE